MATWLSKLFNKPMKILELNIPERLVALSIFNNPENKVPTADLKLYLEDVSKFRLSDSDKELVKWEDIKAPEDVKDKDGNVTIVAGTITSYQWNEAGVDPKRIEIDEFTRKFLEEKIGKLEVTASDPLAGSIASLLEKSK